LLKSKLLFVCLIACLFVCLVFCLLVCLFVCVLDCLFVCLFACLLFVSLFVCLVVCLIVCSFVRLFFVCVFDCLFDLFCLSLIAFDYESLEIRGIPIKESECTNEVVKSVADLVDVEIDEEDISISHRIPSKKTQGPAIIVTLISRDQRDRFYRARKNLRGKTTSNLHGYWRFTPRKIYIAESLTSAKKELFNKCLKKGAKF